MTDNGSSFMQIVERIEAKLDDIRDRLHEVNVMTNVTQTKQMVNESEIVSLRAQVVELKTAQDKAKGAIALLSLPGILSMVYTITQFLAK